MRQPQRRLRHERPDPTPPKTAAARSSCGREQTVWLTQLEMAELLMTTNISLHLKNIFEGRGVGPAAIRQESLTVQVEVAARYSARSRFTTSTPSWPWATACARRVACSSAAGRLPSEGVPGQGFVMDDERLKNPDGRPDYFDEMLARIRDIRASENASIKRCATSSRYRSDYDKTDKSHAGVLRHGAEPVDLCRDAEDGCRAHHGAREPCRPAFRVCSPGRATRCARPTSWWPRTT